MNSCEGLKNGLHKALPAKRFTAKISEKGTSSTPDTRNDALGRLSRVSEGRFSACCPCALEELDFFFFFPKFNYDIVYTFGAVSLVPHLRRVCMPASARSVPGSRLLEQMATLARWETMGQPGQRTLHPFFGKGTVVVSLFCLCLADLRRHRGL